MNLKRRIRYIAYIRVKPTFTIEETRKIRALNFAISLSLPLQTIFCTLNILQGYYFLGLLNSLMVLGNFLTVALQYYGYFKPSRTFYIIGIMAFFTFTHIYFHSSS